MQIILPSELEQLIQSQLAAGKYQTVLDVITAGIHLLDQRDDIHQGRLPELQQDAQVGWEAAQRGELVEGPIAMAQIRENLRSRYASAE
jgi:antitoxin ParD1/3/4